LNDQLDLITIGRSSVDLYGAQVGGRLEDMRSFDKYIGGSPTNIACGTARLGLKSAVITAVGDEHMGRFIREELHREGVNTEGVKIDPDRLTALVLLGIRDQEQFPLIFYRENCADMGLTVDDIDIDFIQRARAVVATGTHLSHPQVEQATYKALETAKAAGKRTALDIDYRPNLWGVAGHGDGESRFVASQKVTERLQSALHLFDLIVGTEEEFHIAGGTTDTVEALRAVRQVSDATLICKRGAAGAVAFAEAIPDILGCTPAYPSWEELQYFFNRGVQRPDLRNDAALEQVHWATNRHIDWSSVRIFAFDHRIQLEELAGASPHKIGAFKKLCLDAAVSVSKGRTGYGLLCDSRLGREALYKTPDTGLWVGRPVEWPGSRPLSLEPELGIDFGGLSEWPRDQVVKVLCFCHPEDDAQMWAQQESTIARLYNAVRRNRLEFLLEVIPSKVGAVGDTTTAELIQRFYDIGIYPDWWKLEPMLTDNAWIQTITTIEKNDPNTRGIVILGLGETEEKLAESFKIASQYPLVKGFAVGRTIFAESAKLWMLDQLSDEDAIANMTSAYQRLCDTWDDARKACS